MDNKTVISFWRWLLFHQWLEMCLSLTTLAEQATDTFLLQQESVSCEDLSILENGTCPFRTQSAKLFTWRLQLISRRLKLLPPDLLLNLHCTVTQSSPTKLFLQTLSKKLFLQRLQLISQRLPLLPPLRPGKGLTHPKLTLSGCIEKLLKKRTYLIY